MAPILESLLGYNNIFKYSSMFSTATQVDRGPGADAAQRAGAHDLVQL